MFLLIVAYLVVGLLVVWSGCWAGAITEYDKGFGMLVLLFWPLVVFLFVLHGIGNAFGWVLKKMQNTGKAKK